MEFFRKWMVKIWIMKKENYYKLLYVGIILLIIGFVIRVIIDFVQYNVFENSAPFYIFIFVRILEFIVPSSVLFLIARAVKRKYED